MPAVTVVVATCNRAHLLPRLFDCLDRQQGAPPFEVVIVDDSSTDGTGPVLARLVADSTLDVRMARTPSRSGPGPARNVGLRLARGPVVAFTDDDCAPTPDWLAGLAGALDRADIAQGRTLPDPGGLAGAGAFSRTIAIEREAGFYETCNIAYRRDLLERLGGFDERIGYYGEDTDLAWRGLEAGATTAFVPAAIVHHDVWPSSYRTRLRESRRRPSLVPVVRRHPGLRTRFDLPWFVLPAHAHAVVAGAGAAVAAWGIANRRRGVAAVGAAMAAAYVNHRTRTVPLRGRKHWWPVALPLELAADLVEVGGLAAASVRHRTLLL